METRAEMDAEGVKALLLINGGGAVALLALLPQVLDKQAFRPLAVAAIWALLMYVLGLVCAVVHNRLRRICSLEYKRAQGYSPDVPGPCKSRWVAWIASTEPCVCCVSIFFMWASIALFIAGGFIVFVGGYRVI